MKALVASSQHHLGHCSCSKSVRMRCAVRHGGRQPHLCEEGHRQDVRLPGGEAAGEGAAGQGQLGHQGALLQEQVHRVMLRRMATSGRRVVCVGPVALAARALPRAHAVLSTDANQRRPTCAFGRFNWATRCSIQSYLGFRVLGVKTLNLISHPDLRRMWRPSRRATTRSSGS